MDRHALIEDHRENSFRSGEGSAVELRDGRLLLMYTAFRGDASSDHSAAEIFQRRSPDGGETWEEPSVAFSRPPEALNVMSVSLLRLRDGRLACVYSIKWSRTHCIPHWSTSSDEGASWSEPRPIASDNGYYVVNNDRLVQLRDGTIVLPYALHRDIPADGNDKELLRGWLNGWCGIFHSKDGGQAWTRPETARRFEKKWFTLPSPLRPERMAAVEKQAVEVKYDVFQEPGLVELGDGRLMLWVRSLSHVYCTILKDVDSCGEEFQAMPGLNVSCSPQTIKRVPGSGALVMLYNDRGDTGFGEPGFQNRTPLSAALSHDDGRSWKALPPLEADPSRNYCYFSLLFFRESFLVTYYESALVTNADGTSRRRNLASLKRYLGRQAELTA